MLRSFGALAGAVGVLVTLVVWWPRHARRAAARPVAPGQADAAIAYLASETLRYWQVQAKERQITTPSPASVRWAWAGADVAIPAAELQPDRPDCSCGLVSIEDVRPSA